MRTRIFAKAVVFDENGRVLLLTRSATDERRPGQQDFPGGGVNPGEDLTMAICREIKEEAGLFVRRRHIHVFQTKTEIYNGVNIVRLLFWTRVTRPEVTLSFEHSDFQWVEPDEACKLFPHPFYGTGLRYGLDKDIFRTGRSKT